MDEVWFLVMLSIAMLVGSLLSGALPLVVSMSEEKLGVVSIVGAGLLVGTALAVIIPEGVRSLYSNEASTLEHLKSHAHQATLEVDSASLSVQASQHGSHLEPHSVIGIALVLGFVFMLLIDQIGGGHSRNQDAESGGNNGKNRDADSGGSSSKNRSKATATLGLVVHAAADGIALGAAATTSHSDVEMIVFFAIMLHKAPAAFGLVAFLLHSGVERMRIRRHLVVFSLAAPLLALITYFGISQEGKETLSSTNGTGFTMLFSAGTFLYVATIHVLPDVVNRAHSQGGAKEMSEHSGLRLREFLALVGGALLPLLFALGHNH